MKWLVLLVIASAAGFFGYPLLNEDAGGECDALERATVRVALSTDDTRSRPHEQVLGQLVQGLSKGQFANIAVRNEYPNVPVAAACTMLYWRAILDPKGLRNDADKLRS